MERFAKFADILTDLLRQAVRPLVTLGFCYAFIVLTFMKLVSSEVFVGVAMLVIKYWFDSRDNPKNNGGVPEVKP